MKVQLVLLDGSHRGHRVTLTVGEVVVGRARGSKVRLASERISRKHCRLWLERKKLWIQDLGSQNGTYVNDEVAIGKVQLKPEDEIKLAHIRFRVEFDPADSSPVPEPKTKRPPTRKGTLGDVEPEELELIPLDEPQPDDFDLPFEDEEPTRPSRPSRASETYDIPVSDPADFRDILRELDEGSEDD